MYFPTLSTMSHYQVDDFLSRKLDVWLATRRKATRKFLSPLQFSLDTDIDQEIAISLFVLCTERDIDLLSVKYVIECPCCNRIIGTYESSSDIPENLSCIECNRELAISKEDIIMWFQLNKEPVSQPLSETRGNNCLGKI